MRKFSIVVLIAISSIFLTSCSKKYIDHAGTFEMVSFEFSEGALDDFDFDVIEEYKIQLKASGEIKETFRFGVMDKAVSVSDLFELDLEKELLLVNRVYNQEKYTDEYLYTGDTITIVDLMIAVVSDPDPKEEDHYTSITIFLQKVK